MKSQVVVTALALFGSMAVAQTEIGCYKSTNGLTFKDKWDWQSVGRCSGVCAKNAAYGMIDKLCYCGDKIPADADKVSDSQCGFSCPGFPENNCGGSNNRIMIYSTDKSTGNIPKADADTSTSSSTASSKPTSTDAAQATVITTEASGATVTVSAPAVSSESESSGSKPNTAGIAAGVVVGVLAILGIAGGAFLFIRRRKRRAIEEEHRRNATINSFVGKPPMSAGSSSFTDTRLDPVMAQRRMSDGSIADNQDYSRRILKVTNA